MQQDTSTTLSPDGKWRWDGSQWVPATASASTPAPAPATLSPDGRWQWDGAQWTPVGGAAPQTLPQQAQAGAPACQVCGAQPAAEITLRQHTGFLVYWVNRRFRFMCCRDCGLALFRQKQNLTLMTGWWGPASVLIWNWVTIVWNLFQRNTVVGLPAPARPAGATALDPGRPVYQRPGMVVACLVGLILLALVVFVAWPTG